jgi:hypothetical protein
LSSLALLLIFQILMLILTFLTMFLLVISCNRLLTIRLLPHLSLKLTIVTLPLREPKLLNAFLLYVSPALLSAQSVWRLCPQIP